MFRGHRILEKVEVQHFFDLIRYFDESRVILTNHAFFRLDHVQRKVFKEGVLKDMVLRDVPVLVGLQANKNYAVFYRYGSDFFRVVLDVKPGMVYVVTFYLVKQLPRF